MLRQEVVISGIALRLPGASSCCEFRQALLDGRNVFSTMPWERFEALDAEGCALLKAEYPQAQIGLIEPQRWDGDSYGIPASLSASMDPQHRLLLMLGREALADAGLDPATVAKGGVLVATGSPDFGEIALLGDSDRLGLFTALGLSACMGADRLAGWCGWDGATFTIDSACASVLTALLQGRQLIESGEADVVLVGGVSLIASSRFTLMTLRAGLASESGQHRAFDCLSDGYVRSEGGAVFVLERGDLCRERDTLPYAGFEGGATGHCSPIESHGHVFYSSSDKLSKLFAKGLSESGVEPAQVASIQLHGVGLERSDNVEAEAVGVVFGHRPLVHSAKSVFGYLEWSAAVVGILGALVALGTRMVPVQHRLLMVSPAASCLRWGAGVLEESGKVGVVALGIGGSCAFGVLATDPRLVWRGSEGWQ